MLLQGYLASISPFSYNFRSQNRLLSKELKLESKVFFDKATQTTIDIMSAQKRHKPASPIDSAKYHTPMRVEKIPDEKENSAIDTNEISMQRRQSSEKKSGSIKSAEKVLQSPRRLSVSPEIQRKVMDHLRTEVINEISINYSTPESQPTRPRRSTAKNISYIEPALNVKVRRGFYKRIFTEKH
jgi:hypothetical protein